MKRRAAAALALGLLLSANAAAEPFSYLPPGDLVADSGEGRVDYEVYAPGMRFPIESAPAYANSQVWGNGGMYGPGGSECDAENFAYPFRDNYCEKRSWDMPLCPSGTGHQGQDIRPATCAKDVHWAVATEDGTVTHIGSYSVYVTASDGTRFDYLHMSNVQVAVGESVTRGQRVGKVSDVFDGTPTTTHLHFNIKQFVEGVGTVFVPPYLSLVQSYESLVAPPNAAPIGALDAADCTSVRGWAQDPDAPGEPIEAHVYFDGNGLAVLADRYREDLCSALGSCEHAFEAALPLSVLDGKPHAVTAYGADSAGGESPALDGGPKTITCSVELPEGVRRLVAGPASMAAWHLSALLDQLSIDDAALGAFPEGPELPEAPELVTSAEGAAEVWLVDPPRRRLIADATTAAAWDLDLASAEPLSVAELDAMPLGTPLRPRPFLVKASGPSVYLLDDEQPPLDSPGTGGAGLGGAAAGAGSDGSGFGGEPSNGPPASTGADASGDAAGSGCGCGAAGRTPAAPGALALALLALFRLRRRRRP